MAAFFNDLFTGTDGTAIDAHTSDSGHSYEALSGFGNTVEIRTNRIHSTGGSARWRPILTSPSADYENTILVYCHTDDDQFVACDIRASDTALYTVLFNRVGEAQIWSLAGMLASGFTVAPQAGQTYRVKIAVKGTLIRGFVDRYEFAFVTDATYSAAGKPMFGFEGTTGNTAGLHIDSAYANALFDEDQIVFIGDSLTAGEGLTRAESYPYKVIAELADGTTDWANRGVGGQTAATILTNVAVYSNLSRSAASRNIAVMLAGTNDLAINGSTLGSTSTLLTKLYGIADALTTAGFRVVMQTIPYADESSANIPAGYNAAVDTVNADLLANYSSHARKLVDTNDILGTSPSANFQADGVHTTDAGTTLQAAGIVAAIQSMERVINLRGFSLPLAQPAY